MRLQEHLIVNDFNLIMNTIYTLKTTMGIRITYK
jgi:hypothetical protein